MSAQREGNQAVTDRLMADFPEAALKHRAGGRNGLAYYSGDTIIRRLIAATDNQFDVSVTDYQMTDTLITARVRLTIPGMGSREHIGVQRWTETTKSGAQSGEDLIKGAITDAIKKAATLFGVALELYGEDYEGAAEEKAQTSTRPQTRPQASKNESLPPNGRRTLNYDEAERLKISVLQNGYTKSNIRDWLAFHQFSGMGSLTERDADLLRRHSINKQRPWTGPSREQVESAHDSAAFEELRNVPDLGMEVGR